MHVFGEDQLKTSLPSRDRLVLIFVFKRLSYDSTIAALNPTWKQSGADFREQSQQKQG